MNCLTVKNLSCNYKNFRALDNITFSLKSGTFAVLLGENGCGKSTLLRCICGLQPFSGSCLFSDSEIKTLSVRQKAQNISYLEQNSFVALHLSVLEIVCMGFFPLLKPFEKVSAKQQQQALAVLKHLGISALADKDFLTLSGGQQQLVLFARTLVRKAPLLILDEPDSALDFENHHLILQSLSDYAHQTKSIVLLCTHNPSVALQYADQILLMKNGQLKHSVLLSQTSKQELEYALQNIFGNIELVCYKNKYLMVQGENNESRCANSIFE